jgi:hypothetical protein
VDAHSPAITLSPEQQTVLESQARSRSLSVQVVERARIVLFAACRKRFPAGQALSRAARGRIAKRLALPRSQAYHRRALDPPRRTLTTRQTPANATHWRTRSMAAAVGISEACGASGGPTD